MDSNLNFTCVPGDLILARSRALRVGPVEFSPDSYDNNLNRLGDSNLFDWGIKDNDHMTPCTVLAMMRFPQEAENLNYLIVLAVSRLAYLFDNPENGFWVPIDLKAQSARSMSAWMNPFFPALSVRGCGVLHAHVNEFPYSWRFAWPEMRAPCAYG
jgi:hypothetical protein